MENNRQQMLGALVKKQQVLEELKDETQKYFGHCEMMERLKVNRLEREIKNYNDKLKEKCMKIMEQIEEQKQKTQYKINLVVDEIGKTKEYYRTMKEKRNEKIKNIEKEIEELEQMMNNQSE